MRFLLVLIAGQLWLTRAANLVLSNDDGWAELNIRTFFNTLTASGHKVILSAPADNMSRTGSKKKVPEILKKPCHYNSCATGSPATGFNSTNRRLNYVNSYPATAMEFGLQKLAPKLFKKGRGTDLAITGMNVGVNTACSIFGSGTVGAACEAVSQGVPAIAFNAKGSKRLPYTTTPVPLFASVAADLAVKVTEMVLAGGKPYLPSNTFLNVNIGPVSPTKCSKASEFKFVLSRIHPVSRKAFLEDDKNPDDGMPPDVSTCGSLRLPSELSVIMAKGCWVSISAGHSKTKKDYHEAQAPVLARLRKFLTCLPK
ncbi:sure-like protein [Myriangium duriaei CBS 260.36]|uniref:Sure-like protein n=1 Tax=Myriangium duriaei CBS 260.36 TaxID=1168546 RepID=A0A9P4ISQ5_9PEZI|nr:sure-like protein [Myriangium duriaei CBS 260.36]